MEKSLKDAETIEVQMAQVVREVIGELTELYVRLQRAPYIAIGDVFTISIQRLTDLRATGDYLLAGNLDAAGISLYDAQTPIDISSCDERQPIRDEIPSN